MEYKVFKLKCPEDLRDIFIAELGELGFDMMQETDYGLEAFSENEKLGKADTDILLEKYGSLKISGEWAEVENTNWNEEWEKNYDPVIVEDKCLIKADFHKVDGSFPFELIINPRMSFGTGHHATTYLMVQAAFESDIKDKNILDAGCGTGVLAILAEKMGAKEVLAYDVSQLCVDNSADNLEANACTLTRLETGTLEEISHLTSYDLIFANINKNVLLAEVKGYSGLLAKNGRLLLSGFFDEDAADVADEAERNQLKLEKKLTKDGWACLILSKVQ